MITADSTLEDICFAVAAALETRGMSGVLTGGSAAALYAPQAYMSLDADFILQDDDSLDDVDDALRPIDFHRNGEVSHLRRSRFHVHR